MAASPSQTELVSVVTPTYQRPELLPTAYSVFASQTYPNIEWIIVDDSAERCTFFDGLDDQRVRYFHLGERTSTGRKRNFGNSEARGQIIAQFDDDDFYHAKYIEVMVRAMSHNNADLIKLASFFVFHQKTGALGYWKLRERNLPNYAFTPRRDITVGHILPEKELADIHLGYGFCYVYRRSVWEASPFPDIFWNQDTPFVKKAVENRFKIALMDDTMGIALHIIHDRNVSQSFPQFLLPEFMLTRYFPTAADFLKSLDGNDPNRPSNLITRPLAP